MQVRSVLRGVLAAVLAFSSFVVVDVAAAPRAAAAEVPWTCTSTAYLFQSPNGASVPHDVIAVDLVTGSSTTVGQTVDQINAVGYNAGDGYMYAWDLTLPRRGVVRVSADLSLTPLGAPAGLPAAFLSAGYNVGEFDADGHLWVIDNQSGRWIEIDLADPTSATYNTALAWGTLTMPAGLLIPGDLALVGGALYGVAPTTSGTGPARLVQFNTSTRTFQNLGLLPAQVASGSTYGAVYSDGTYVYASRNQGGAIFRITPSTREAVQLATGPASSSNDGARCPGRIPTVTIEKQVAGRLDPADQFVVTLVGPSGDVLTDATTTGTSTEAVAPAWSVQRGATYTITDDVLAGSPSTLADYTPTLECRDASTLGAQPVGNPGPATWQLTISPLIDDYVCTVTNVADPPAPALTLTKSAVLPSGFATGQPVDYTFVVRNDGNVPLTGIIVDEVTFTGTGTLPPATCAATALAPGEQTTCTSQYVLTQQDVDAGQVSNVARANGTDPGGTPVPSNDSPAEVPGAAEPALTLEKSASPPTVAAVGAAIDYTFTVTNTGNVSLSNVTVDETSFSGSGTPPLVTCPGGVLLPGQVATCTAGYITTQADLDSGQITNTAVATGDPPGGGTTPSDPDDAVVPVAQSPLLVLAKSAEPTRVAAAGETVSYTYTVTNTGNVTVDDVTIAELAFTGSAPLPAASCGPEAASLAPTASVTCTADYVVTADDIARGDIRNTAAASGTDPGGDPVISLPDDAVVGVIPAASLALTKSATPTTVTRAGDLVTYTYTITNTGDATVTGVRVEETAFTGTGTPGTITCAPGAAALAPGDAVTCTSTYTVTAEDILAGGVSNTATALGQGPDGDVTSPPAEAVVDVTPVTALVIDKSAEPATVTAAGETVTYTFVVTNTGNQTIDDVRVEEDEFTGSGALSAPQCGNQSTSLLPAGTLTCTATYVVTSADLAAMPLENTAHADGTGPDDRPVESAVDDASVIRDPGGPAPSSSGCGSRCTLPQTGTDVQPAVAAALTLLASGAVLLVLKRTGLRTRPRAA